MRGAIGKYDGYRLYLISFHAWIDIVFIRLIRWLGNAGSHSSQLVTIDDVLDSYELIIELIDEIFSKKRIKAKTLAKKIIKKKGPK